MTWLQLDDAMPWHPRMVGLTPAAVGVWTLGLCYASHYLTDGFLDEAALPYLKATTDTITELVDAGAWEPTTDPRPGYLIRNYLDKQRSRAEVERQRKADADRKRKSRATRPTDVTPDSDRSHAGVRLPEAEAEAEAEAETAAAAANSRRRSSVEVGDRLLELSDALTSKGIGASWSKITPGQANTIADLVDTHGIKPLVDAAVLMHQPDNPAAYINAFLSTWSMMPAAKSIARTYCDVSGHEYELTPCRACRADALVEGAA